MTVDLAIVGVFVAATLFIGLTDRSSVTLEVYWVNDRKTGVFALIATTLSTFIGAASIFGLASLAYSGAGAAALVLPISYLAYFLIFARYFAPKIKEFGDARGAYSLPDYLESRYSRRVRVAGAVINLVTLALYTAVQFVAFGSFIASVLELSPVLTTVIGGIVAICYSAVGGMRADIRTDIFQFCIMMVLLTIVLPSLLFSTGAIEAVRALPVEFLRGDSFASPVVIICAVLFLGAGTLTSTDLWQRAYAAESKRSLERAFSVTALLVLAFLMMGASLGLFGRALLPGIDPNMVVPTLLKSILPSGVYGVVLAGLVAAVMSTVDTLLIVMSLTIVHDLYLARSGRTLSAAKTLALSRWVTFALGVLSLVIALVIFSVGQLTIHAVSFYVALLPSIVYGFYGGKKAEAAALWSIVIGFSVTGVCCLVAPVEAFIPGLIASVVTFYLLKR